MDPQTRSQYLIQALQSMNQQPQAPANSGALGMDLGASVLRNLAMQRMQRQQAGNAGLTNMVQTAGQMPRALPHDPTLGSPGGPSPMPPQSPFTPQNPTIDLSNMGGPNAAPLTAPSMGGPPTTPQSLMPNGPSPTPMGGLPGMAAQIMPNTQQNMNMGGAAPGASGTAGASPNGGSPISQVLWRMLHGGG